MGSPVSKITARLVSIKKVVKEIFLRAVKRKMPCVCMQMVSCFLLWLPSRRGCLVNLWAVCIHSEVIAARDVCAVFWKEKDADEVSSDSESGGPVTIRERLKGKFACAPMAAFKNNA